MEVLFTSGISTEDHDLLQRMPGRWELFAHFRRMPRPLRLTDYPSYAVEMGLPAFDLLPVGAFLSAPVRHGGENIGYIHLARNRGEEEFPAEDEETLSMFASHEAMVIANARQRRRERRARADLEALADISPVGVLVFDPITGMLRTANGEARRIGGARSLSTDPALHVLSNLSVCRPNGAEISLSALALARGMSGGQKLQAEEMTVVPVERPPVVCKGIVEAHGAGIWAESDGPDLGSRITFTLPVAGEMTAASDGTPTATAASPGTSRRNRSASSPLTTIRIHCATFGKLSPQRATVPSSRPIPARCTG